MAMVANVKTVQSKNFGLEKDLGERLPITSAGSTTSEDMDYLLVKHKSTTVLHVSVQ